MSREFSLQTLRLVVGHICQNIGWQALQQSSLNILVDILYRYIIELAKCTADYANFANRTESNTEDVFLTFLDFGVRERELLEYMLNVDTLPFPKKLPNYPIEQPPCLFFPKTTDPQRPEWIDSHLPSIQAQKEEEEEKNEDEEQQQQQQVVPLSPQIDNGVRRAEDGSLKITINKKIKGFTEEGTPMRKVRIVAMTASGIIKSLREGKLPDKCHPSKLIDDSDSSEDSFDESCGKCTKKRKKPNSSKSKAYKIFAENVGGPLVPSIKTQKQKEKKGSDSRKGKKRKASLSPKVAKASRVTDENRMISPATPNLACDTADESEHPERVIYTVNDSQASVNRSVNESVMEIENSMDDRDHFVRGIDSAISTVVEDPRGNVTEGSADEAAYNKLQVDDFYELSDRGTDFEINVTERPKTPDVFPTGSLDADLPRSIDGFGSNTSPLMELMCQIPNEQPTREDSSSFLGPSDTPMSAPQTPTLPMIMPRRDSVNTSPEEKEPEIKTKKKEKKKNKKDKRDKKDKKKEVPKLTLKLSSISLSEPLFTPTPLVTIAPPMDKGKSSVLKSMIKEIDSDSNDGSPKRLASPRTPKTPRSKEAKRQLAKKEKNTPSRAVPPLPAILPELTVTHETLASPSTKKDKRKEKTNKKESEPRAMVKDRSFGAQVEVVTVGSTFDDEGNKIWICPSCAKPDDGTPMIGCDGCDDWYHWVCVGIQAAPSEDVQWFCKRCRKAQKKQKKKK